MIEEVFYSCNENYDKLQWNMKTCNQKFKSLLIIDQPTIHLGSIYYSLSTPRDTMGDFINSSHKIEIKLFASKQIDYPSYTNLTEETAKET